MKQDLIHIMALDLRSDVETTRSLCISLRRFIQSVELVFNHDWEHTKASLNAKPDGWVIAEDGTFLEPRADDESNNWGNRGCFLQDYRKLLAVMRQIGLYQTFDEYMAECEAADASIPDSLLSSNNDP